MSQSKLTHFFLPPVLIEIKPSKILKNEVGVFAVRSLSKNTTIIKANHFSNIKIIKWKYFNKFDSIAKKKIMSFCPATPEGFFTPPDLNYLSIAWHLNHSCNPNIGFNKNYDFVTMRAIKKGEELCWDYGFDETNPNFKMKCLCGYSNCRKVITGNDWEILMKDPKKYLYFSPKLKKFIKQKDK